MPYAVRLPTEEFDVEAIAAMEPLLNTDGTFAPSSNSIAVTTPPAVPPIEALIRPSLTTAPPPIVTSPPSTSGVGQVAVVPGIVAPIFATFNTGVLVSVGS